MVTLSNPVKLHYIEQGDPDGVPALLLHGYTDSCRSYEPVLSHLPTSIHAFALSQRGHGDTDRPFSGYQPADFAADLVAFMDSARLARAVIVGHSMGSLIAQRFALDYPDRTLGLVLVGSFIAPGQNPEALALWDAVSNFEDPIDPGFVLAFQQSTLARAVPEEFLETVVKESLKVPARVWRGALAAIMETDFSSELGKIKSPTLIVWGDQDGFCPRSDQEALAAAIEGSRLTVYPGAGHAPHWEEPDRFAADLVAFTERIKGL
jgi:pimeloyl-ACP methyl ester carboxylesterase